jgi:hypothetical protein
MEIITIGIRAPIMFTQATFEHTFAEQERMVVVPPTPSLPEFHDEERAIRYREEDARHRDDLQQVFAKKIPLFVDLDDDDEIIITDDVSPEQVDLVTPVVSQVPS